MTNLTEVLSRLSNHGLRLKQEICSFMQNSIEYLGHHIDATGIHTAISEVEAIAKAPAPKNATQLHSFLGMINYYEKFILNLSAKLHPLYALLKNGTKWNWSSECAHVFEEIKTLLIQAPVLMHYNPKLPIRLVGNASNYVHWSSILEQYCLMLTPQDRNTLLLLSRTCCQPVSETTPRLRRKHCD